MIKCKFYRGTETVTPTSTKIKCEICEGGGKVFENKDPEGKMIAGCCWSGGNDCPVLNEHMEREKMEQKQAMSSADIQEECAEDLGMQQEVMDGCENAPMISADTGVSIRQEKAVKLTRQIIANGNIAASCMVDMGRDLKAVRDERLYTEIGFDSFEEYCEKKCGIGKRHGYNFIQVYERFGEEQLAQLQGLGITKLLELAKLDDDDLGDLMGGGDVADMSVRELKEKIAEYDKTCEQLRLDLDSVENDLNESDKAKSIAEDERDEIKAQLDRAEKQKNELEERIAALEANDKKQTDRYVEMMKTNQRQIDELKEQHSKEKKEYRDKIQALKEKQGEVSEEQIAAIRAEAEKAAAEKAEEVREEAVKEALKKNDKSWESDKNARIELQSRLEAELEKCKAKIRDLQSNAQSTPTPDPASGAKDKVKFYLGQIQTAFNAAAEVISDLDPEEQDKYRKTMETAFERMKEALNA